MGGFTSEHLSFPKVGSGPSVPLCAAPTYWRTLGAVWVPVSMPLCDQSCFDMSSPYGPL